MSLELFDNIDVVPYRSRIPVAFDNSLDIYEQVTAILEFLNRLINNSNTVTKEMILLKKQFEQFKKDLETKVIPENLELILNKWNDNGYLNVIINEVLQTQIDDVEDRVKEIHVNVKDFGAKGDGITDDTIAIQSAITYLESKYMGEVNIVSGYIRFAYPVLFFPDGIYLTRKINLPRRITLKANGRAVLQSFTGTPDKYDGFFTDSIVTHVKFVNLTFIYFDIANRLQTNNADQSFITFENCGMTKINMLVDTVSYSASRSTTFEMVRCNASYDCKTVGKIYTDKADFKDNWFNHSTDGILLYIDSLARFENNVWVPTKVGLNKAWIEFSGSDQARAISFENERFSGEGGACPIVVVRDVNVGNSPQAYRNQGITFKDCQLNVINPYNPNEIAGGGVRSPIILRPSTIPNKTINFIKFIGCSFSPDLSGGMVTPYAVTDIDNYLPADFVIDFDYASSVSATRGANKLVSPELLKYVHMPILKRHTTGMTSTGLTPVVDTATVGTKKATFKIKRNNASYQPAQSFLVTLIGQGDSSYNSNAYVSTATYILDVSGVNLTSTNSQINFTKLHSSKSGAGEGAKPEIISAHFGKEDTGSNQKAYGGSVDEWAEITIVFGTRIMKGTAYIKPMFDFSLLS